MIRQFNFPAQRQGRKEENIQPSLSVRALNRSLSIQRPRFAPLRLGGKLLIGLLLLTAGLSGAANAQEPADTIRVQTRVVFLDALVKDKRTGNPISDLKLENFQVLDDGQPRSISYFTREGQARKPLALMLILDCREDGAGRFLKRPEILKAMADELAKLTLGDEVAIMAMNIGEDEHRVWLTEFTNDRAKIEAALARVPSFVDSPDSFKDDSSQKLDPAAHDPAKPQQNSGSSITINSDSNSGSNSGVDKTAAAAQPSPTPDNVVETEVIKGKNGATIVRTTKTDGSVSVKRTSGNVVVAMDDVYDMAAAVRESGKFANRLRPNSQPSIVWMSDGIAPIFFEDRDATEKLLIRDNIIFNSLTVDLRTLFKFLMPIGKPIAGWVGVSLYGSAKQLAQRSGGEAVRVNRVSDYGSGLSKVIGNLTARYSLGFALAEEEKDGGRLHNLEVRVKAEDAKGKTRKLNVSSRQGYYMPGEAKETTATRVQ
ncbi:MAG TPA: VWA domain-containing protein [Pyrinomonadaceae bacterium]|nr:VWA domain-containing protein [Pyrinomonadaceae bacterium]